MTVCTNYSAFNFRRLLFSLLPLIILAALFAYGASFFSAASKSNFQLLLYPFVLFGLFNILGKNLRLPSVIYFFSVILVLFSAVYVYVYPLKSRKGGLVIARLQDDDLQNETRIFREQINKELESIGDIRAISINESFSTLASAENFITGNKKLRLLVSANKKWVNIFFPEKSPVSLKELGLGLNLPGLSSIKLHYSVRAIGLSREPSSGTTTFIANLAEGVASYKLGSKDDLFEISIINAANVQAFWTSFAHRAYPLWFLGNYYLENSIINGKFSRPLLSCAVKVYKKGYSLMRKGDNPDLRASILNNLGVAYILRGYIIGKKRDIKIGKKYFILAERVYKDKSKIISNFSAAAVASENLAVLSWSKHKFAKPAGKKFNLQKLKGQKVKEDKNKKNNTKKVKAGNGNRALRKKKK